MLRWWNKKCRTGKKIINLGCEKIAISSAIFNRAEIINEISKLIGRQSIVVVLDIKKSFLGGHEIYTHNGTKKVKKSLDALLEEINDYGVGELVINSIDRDGTRKGFDINLMEKIYTRVSSPLTILGGANSEKCIIDAVSRFNLIGAAAGSMFVFKGTYDAVLISYISDETRKKIKTMGSS